MAKFKQKYDYSRRVEEYSIREVVEHGVTRQDHDGGMMEDIKSQLENITKVLAEMAETLPVEAQLRLADKLGFEEF